MSAIGGLWRFDNRPDAAGGCSRILSAQTLYGVHCGRQLSDGGIALGRRLTKLVPEDAFDRQPLIGAKGRYILVADVRLDNRDELISKLLIPASEARILSDAAILLAAIMRWEESCFEHLVGDYAFALWNREGRSLTLARDPLGQRPLHYHRCDAFFAFGSMPKGLHALSEIPYAPDEERIAEFLLLMPEIGPRSFFLGVERVEPGHVVTVTANGCSARRHWRPRKYGTRLRRPDDYVEALRALLDQAVRCRLRGAHDVGAYLSGGLDSSAVAATAARLLAPSGQRIIAFTAAPSEGYKGVAPPNTIIDEGPHAAATAAHYSNMEHVLIRRGSRSPLDHLDRDFFLLDRPVMNICNIGWSHDICAAMRKRRLAVALVGDMGNLGLSYDGMELLPELFRSGRWLDLQREARALVSGGVMRWRGVLARTFGPWCPPRLWIWLNKIAHGHAPEFADYSAIHPDRWTDLNLIERAKLLQMDPSFRPPSDSFALRFLALRSADAANYYKGVLGGWQVDIRDPTSDVRLLEFCLAVPTDQYLRNGAPRSLARRALADRLPKAVVEETRSGRQAADWHEGMTAAHDRLISEIDRLEACPLAARALDLARIRHLATNWPSGGWERDEINVPYRYMLLRAISAGHFLRRASGYNL